jgi:O-antigen/teichoic acid export membrane protein
LQTEHDVKLRVIFVSAMVVLAAILLLVGEFDWVGAGFFLALIAGAEVLIYFGRRQREQS